MPNEIPTLDFNDTFLDVDHLRNSFPNYDIEVKVDDEQKLVPPFRYLQLVFLFEFNASRYKRIA